jgi:hypothetical protein
VAARLRFLVPAVLAAAAFSVPAASAGLIGNLLGGGLLGGGLLGGNCPSGGSQVFSAWQDFANYYLAPNGSFELGTTGWSLSGGAHVVSGNEPFLPTGSHSLALPSGSSALSPSVCLGPKQLYVRMFAADGAGTDRGLRVRVVWYGLLNKVLGISDYAVFEPGHDWSPTSKLNSSGGLQVPLVPLLGSTSARVEITPLGAGSAWQVDDLYIDPSILRIG